MIQATKISKYYLPSNYFLTKTEEVQYSLTSTAITTFRIF